MWEGLHPAVQPAATPPEPRVPDREVEKQALPLQHLRQGVRYREQPQDSHWQGQYRGRGQEFRDCSKGENE